MNEKSNATKRREWVKNAAIIFLSVMLVLTFFSNTIMNYSLPEVATEYVQSGTITAKVRGTGNLEATDPYNVVISESRKIESVNVKNGDTVEKDSVLFYLEDVDSEELKTAQKELDDLRLAYLTGLFTGDITSDVINKVENGKTGTLASYQARLAEVDSRLTAAKNRLTAATANQQSVQSTLDNLNGQKNLNEAVTVDTSNEEKAVNSAQTNVTNATAEVTRIKNEITETQAKIDAATALLGTLTTSTGGNVSLQGGIKTYQDAKDKAENDLKAATTQLQNAKAVLDTAIASGIVADIEAAQKAYDEIKLYIYDVADSQLKVATSELESATATLKDYDSNNQLLASLKSSLEGAQSALNSANSALVSAQNALNNKKLDSTNTSAKNDLNTQLATATNSKTKTDTEITNITAEITKIQEEKSTLIKTLTAELNLSAQNTQIAQKEAAIEKLKEESVGANVTAPVAGTITSVSHVAGESTKPDEVLAVIQPTGKGFTLSFSATTEQAKKLSVGDIAEVQNSWYYEDVKATLVSIKPDQTDPAQKKQLTFNIEGDVQAGQALSLAVGQKSANYELVVPNSAIREDKNGKFILIVESKSSPLGNRYIATRIDVEVQASDDTHTAISAGLYGYEYVITTATKPVEAGKQVRLTD
ncbi:HlyD family secretion protein [Kineothrix alysoides]|uniref:HlyD family secretion protein n=1 Tax=Kineothrix alysoides TaxID=1469948 RepID=A0A4R1QPB2_9FIRM|nr:HlyD family efflux transporter periplasmic adaptor subunit [Kineothrix alysoides]TCL55649.1 HlyD family secretion protein [Kineothrix alysoides]